MAADVIGSHFTMIANAAARDRRLSRRARGLLLEILSHRDGFGISEASLIAGGPEGRDAIRTALRELERYGYLHRVQERDERGRLGESVFYVTDMPEGLLIGATAPWETPDAPEVQNRRSEPVTENPSTDTPSRNRRSEPLTDYPSTVQPSTGNPRHKKTNNLRKTTNRPSVRDADPRAATAPGTDGRTDGGGIEGDQEDGAVAAGGAAAPADAAPAELTPGVELLLEIAAADPAYLLTGQTLVDQGRMVTGLLASGWPQECVRQVIAGRPLPQPLTRTVGAVVAARLRAAARVPAPPAAGRVALPTQGGPADIQQPEAPERSSTLAAARPVAEAFARRVFPECAGCGRPVVPGRERCAACLGWPECEAGCGLRVEDGGRCPTCADAAWRAEREVEPADDGTCPGHAGPCGRPVQSLGLCGRCRIAAEDARRASEERWQQAVAAAVAAATAAETDAQPAAV